MLALLLAVGGGLLWRFAGGTSAPLPTPEPALASPADPAPAQHPAAAAPPAQSIPVLPFDTLHRPTDTAYLVAALPALRITPLALIGDIHALPRNPSLINTTP